MALKKSEKRLLIILGVAVFGFLFDRFVLSGGDENDAAANVVQNRTQNQNMLLSGVVTPDPIAVSEKASQNKQFETWGRDPFSLISSGNGESRSRPILKGIFWNQDKSYVLIDDLILSEGEEAEGIRIEKIREEEVLCYQGGQLFTLHWRESP
ncbi:hypothetical protein JW824_11675 [bacterium]|nr:hypothetical protein [bacterium]